MWGIPVKHGSASSRLGRSVGCAALTLLLAATTCPTFGAPVARAVESLSAAERASLPDTTLIKLTTRTVSLGILRSEHQLRLKRFANAATLGKQHRLFVPAAHGAFVPRTSLISTLVPMDFSLSLFSPSIFFNYSVPADFLAFCQAAVATACLYLPGGVPLRNDGLGGASLIDEDPLITDFGLCNSEGGVPIVGGCAYFYATTYSLNFDPGQPTAQGYNVTQSANCPSPFSYTVDPHGAVRLAYNGGVPVSGLPSVQSCVVSAYVNK